VATDALLLEIPIKKTATYVLKFRFVERCPGMAYRLNKVLIGSDRWATGRMDYRGTVVYWLSNTAPENKQENITITERCGPASYSGGLGFNFLKLRDDSFLLRPFQFIMRRHPVIRRQYNLSN
jgi:hypothetical protein